MSPSPHQPELPADLVSSEVERLSVALAERNRLSSLLETVGAILAIGGEVPVVLQNVAEAIQRSVDAGCTCIWTTDGPSTVLQATVSRTADCQPQHDLSWLAQRRRPYVTNAAADDSLLHSAGWIREQGWNVFAGYPLVVEDRVVGVMAIFGKRELSGSAQRTLAALARQLGWQIDRLRLERANQYQAALIESTDDAIVSDDLRGQIVSWNAGAERIFGYAAAEALGQPLEVLVPEDHRVRWRELREHLMGGESAPSYETQRIRRDGQMIDVAVTVSAVRGAQGEILGTATIARDISPRRQAERALLKTQQHLLLALDAGAMGTWEWDTTTGKLHVSSQAARLHGFKPGVIPLDFEQGTTHILPEDMGALQERINAMLTDPRHRTIEYRVRWPDGTVHWIESRGQLTQTSTDARMQGVCLDITVRKQAEEALRAEQQTLKRLFEAQENERQLIAYEIHDGIVQYATGGLMHLQAYLHGLGGAPAKKLAEVQQLLQRTVQEGRRLLNGIRPPVLDEFGVVAAVQHLIRDYRAAVPDLELVIEGEFGRLTPSLETTVYRLIQEALTNVQRHSGSQRCRVMLARIGNKLQIEVRDWGCGFDPGESPKQGWGLRGFGERVRLAGGKLRVESKPGIGTTVSVELPAVPAAEISEGALDSPVSGSLDSTEPN
jgi:PAS domain S-box-containing protein